MIKKIKIKEVVKYDSHSVKSTGVVSLKLTAMYDELVNSLQVAQFLNNNVIIKYKDPNAEKPELLGVFMVSGINVKADGSSVLSFNSINTAVELDNLNNLVNIEGNQFKILMMADVEVEDEEEGENESE